MVQIVLATFNGASWIVELLDSLQRQAEQRFELLVIDDASTDQTCDLIRSHPLYLAGQIRLTCRPNNQGARATFSELMSWSTAPYVMFCDQDDVWLSHKIELLLAMMHKEELRRGADCPILIHSDVTVVDASLQVISPSLWRFQNLDPEAGSRFTGALIQNSVTGCACIINRALLSRCGHIPAGAVMHDWYLALVASAFGVIKWTSQPTVLYRQHQSNALGAQSYGVSAWPRGNAFAMLYRKTQASRQQIVRQAQCFLSQYDCQLSDRHKRLCSELIRLESIGFVQRKMLLIRYGFWKVGVIKNLLWWLLV